MDLNGRSTFPVLLGIVDGGVLPLVGQVDLLRGGGIVSSEWCSRALEIQKSEGWGVMSDYGRVLQQSERKEYSRLCGVVKGFPKVRWY